jgi:hypothetical protein
LPNDTQTVPFLGPEANHRDARVTENAAQFAFAGKTKHKGLEPSAVQSRDDLDEGALGSSGVEVGDAICDSGWPRVSGQVGTFDGQ